MTIYVAIDTADVERAEAIADAVRPHVGGLKLGLEFFMGNGPDGVRRLAGHGLPIFLDVKLHDINNTVVGALNALAVLDVALITVHASIGATALAAARLALPLTTAVIAVTVLTSFDECDLSEIGVVTGVPDQVRRLTDLAQAAGLQGFVCAGGEVAARRAAWPSGIIVVPGLRPAGSDADDQKRVMTPRDAREAGASILVIGRPITAAADPAAAAATIAASL